MCGRFARKTPLDKIKAQYKAAPKDITDLRESYNVAPTQESPVILYSEMYQERQMRSFKWGLVPRWAKDAKVGSKMINTRGETVATKFKQEFENRRCIVPIDGFYEWHVETKQPYYISLKESGLMSLAGIYTRWKSPEGEELYSFSIITCEPNQLVSPIHNRMPVILNEENTSKWLSASIQPKDAETLLVPLDGDQLQAWEVSKAVNNPRNDSKANLERLNSL